MTTIFDVWTALHKGKEILDPENWKNKQLMVNIITALLGVLLFALKFAGMHLPDIDEKTILGLADCIATALGLFNVIVTAATSKKVGLKEK